MELAQIEFWHTLAMEQDTLLEKEPLGGKVARSGNTEKWRRLKHYSGCHAMRIKYYGTFNELCISTLSPI